MNLPEGLTGFSPTKSSRKKSQQFVCVHMRLPAPLNPKKIQPGWLIKLQNKSFDFSLGMCEVDQNPNLKFVIHNPITVILSLIRNPYSLPLFHFRHFSSLIILGTPPQKEAASPRFINSHSEFIYVFMGVPYIFLAWISQIPLNEKSAEI